MGFNHIVTEGENSNKQLIPPFGPGNTTVEHKASEEHKVEG